MGDCCCKTFKVVEGLGLGVKGTLTLEVLGEEPAAGEPAGRVEDLGLGVEGTRTLEVLGEEPAADEPAGLHGGSWSRGGRSWGRSLRLMSLRVCVEDLGLGGRGNWTL